MPIGALGTRISHREEAPLARHESKRMQRIDMLHGLARVGYSELLRVSPDSGTRRDARLPPSR